MRLMTCDDVAAGMRLKEQAGWNQTEADWHRFLDLEPDGCFLAERDGTPVGSVAAFLFGPVAWIAMVLVDPAVRRQGIGLALMRHVLDFLDGRRVASVRLDATPLGRPLYEKLGFEVDCSLARYGGVLPPSPVVDRVKEGRPEHWPALVELDRAVTGTDRGKLLLRLFEEHAESLRVVEEAGRLQGFLTSRPGAKAHFIGPCITRGDAGRLLLEDACRRLAGQPVFIDVPEQNEPAGQLVREKGLTVQRPLVRMTRGRKLVEVVADLWASSGPEKG